MGYGGTHWAKERDYQDYLKSYSSVARILNAMWSSSYPKGSSHKPFKAIVRTDMSGMQTVHLCCEAFHFEPRISVSFLHLILPP